MYNDEASNNSQNTVPAITQKTGNTFNVVIPAMVDGDSLVFNYSAQVNYDMIAVSGNPSFEETGNTAEIFGDSYTLDNKAMYHEMNIEFSDLEKNVTGKTRSSMAGTPVYILNWEIETNKRAQFPLADTDITDTISPVIQNISKYYGDGVTVNCYTIDGGLADSRFMTWEELGVDLANDTSWTYHIPDTDPMYRYVLTCKPIVYMDNATETIVAENTAEGKGGIDSDRAVLPPPGVAGIGVTKKAIYYDSSHVTWEITMTVSGDALDYTQLCMTEHSGANSAGTNWSNNYLPARWINYANDSGTGRWYKETLKKVEIEGLENSETFKVMYSSPNSQSTLITFTPEEGRSVLETDFGGYKWGGDQCQIWFYKDAARTQGGLIKPEGDQPSRTIAIRLYTEYPEEWPTAARDQQLYTSSRDSSIYSHINWVGIETPDSQGKMTTRAKDTDKIIELSQTNDGTTLETGVVYGLREITTPVGKSTNGDDINYTNPHNENFFCCIFTICDEDDTADYSNFVYLADDTMTVRNTPESTSLHVTKELGGNCALSDEEKNMLTYQVFRKQKLTDSSPAIYMPIMTTTKDPNTGQDVETIDPRFINISYSQVAEETGAHQITGMTVDSGASVGEYLLVEYGNDAVKAAHPDWSWKGSYA